MGGHQSSQRAGPLAAVLVLTTILLAGCTDSGSPKVKAPGAPATFDESTGGIEGDILDLEELPVAGARVGILALGIESFSDANGHFSLSNVPPGAHQLSIVALGFEDQTHEVEVTVGEVASATVIMSPLGTIEPFSTTQIRRGLFGCGSSWRPAVVYSGVAICGFVGIADEFVGTNTTAYDNFLILWQVPNSTNGGWNASVFEMKWDSNQFAGKGLSMIWEVDGCSNVRSHRFATVQGRSPLWATANGTVLSRVIRAAEDPEECDDEAKLRCNADECTMHSRVFSSPDTLGPSSAADVGVTFQQPFEQYHTSFYHEPPSDGYTVLK